MNYGWKSNRDKNSIISENFEIIAILKYCDFSGVNENDNGSLHFRDAGLGNYYIEKFPKNIVELLKNNWEKI